MASRFCGIGVGGSVFSRRSGVQTFRPAGLFFSSPFVADEVGDDLGDAGELVGAKLGIHGQGKDFFGGAFGVREGTGFVA
jgi:hypothetical protein